MVTLWVEALVDDKIGAESCLLCQTDSSTAAGRLWKSNFADKTEFNSQQLINRQII
jgi:hypothetical protein